MDWQQKVLDLRTHHKTLTRVAPLVGLTADRLRSIAREDTTSMKWENGDKILKLCESLVPKVANGADEIIETLQRTHDEIVGAHFAGWGNVCLNAIEKIKELQAALDAANATAIKNKPVSNAQLPNEFKG